MSWAKAVSLAPQVAVRHVRTEPARTPLLALRVLPAPVRRMMRGMLLRAGPVPSAYGQWDQGRRDDALATIARAAADARPRRLRRLAAFTVAVERPDAAGPLLDALPERDRARLGALLAAKDGRLREAVAKSEHAPARVRRDLAGRLDALTWTPPPAAKRTDGTPGRVLHIVTNALPTTNAGYTVRTHRLVSAQRAQGLDPHVVTRLGFPVAQGARDPRPLVDVDGISYHRLIPWKLPPTARAALDANVDAASALVERLRPAVLHAASNHVNAQIALELRARHGIPVVYEVRGFLEESWLSRDPRRDTGRDFYRLSRELETACMAAADLVVTLGAAMRDEIVARGVPAEQVLVIPNGVDDVFLRPLPDASGLRASLGIAPDEKVVGTTTSFYGYEGLDTLLAAGARLRDRGRPVRLLLVGDGPERAALERRAADLGLDALFPGRVPADDVRLYHAALDAFVVPRRDERVCRLVTPLKPLEAMAGGVPVIASDLPALREIIDPDVTGRLTLAGDPDDLAEKITSTLYGAGTDRIRDAARAWVHGERTWRIGTERLRDAYRALDVPC
ncbi:GDP-mannose-dependent alpha-(1-6)-phosphatidylinositol monomannoside mannosyltransferase [Actinomadura rubteroloni]|uniref:GDP-mannose-dependent alpha-(1-6)-phosphatidylinositol monomannoside mannosyltransferase n=1 Tax=Actinomadura rubteroloni TaxID=1926885 RepID=A0A2P4UL32_9ACTN|nr:GDP-mannose-dependent alpha-(1-6)-phosphatidylinositol monomannoside mannosyltransferase [Actinomadura rubteroloni]